jgi:4-hydroxy-tetrahydrodipicolinate synthase
MGEEFLDRVGRSRNFCAIKESSGDINRVHLAGAGLSAYPDVLRHGRPGAGVLRLGRAQLGLRRVELPARGAYRALQGLRGGGDFTKGRRIMSAMMPLMRVLEQGGKFIQCIKHGLRDGRLYAGPPRPPLKALNKDDKRQLEQVVRVLKPPSPTSRRRLSHDDLLTTEEYKAIAAPS